MITWGAMVYTADEAAQAARAGRTSRSRSSTCAPCMPWDKEAVLESVRKTSKVLVLHEDTRTGGFGAEIAATIAEEAFEDLDAPVKRITAPDTPVPFSPPLEKALHPAGRRRRRGAQGAGGVLMATGTAIDVVMPQMGVSVSEGTVTKWLRNEGEHDRGRRAAARDLDRQGRHRGAEPRHGRRPEDPRPGGRDRRRRDEARGDRAAKARRRRRRGPPEPEPASRRRRSPRPPRPLPRRDAVRAPRRPRPQRRAEPAPVTGRRQRQRQDVRLAGRRAHRSRARRRRRPVPGTGRGGRVTKKDILAFIERGAPAAPARTERPQPRCAPAPHRPRRSAGRAGSSPRQSAGESGRASRSSR